MEVRLKVPGATCIPELDITVIARVLTVGEERECDPPPVERYSHEAFLDWDAIGGAVVVRTRREGDRFSPLGMRGTKKLKDFFIDEKVPREERNRVPILATEEGRIIWVVGYRIDERFKVRPDTRRLLHIRIRRFEPSESSLARRQFGCIQGGYML